MKTNQGNVLQSLRNVQSFLDTHAASIGTINGTRARKQLDEAIIELTSHESEQRAARHSPPSSRRERRRVSVEIS